MKKLAILLMAGVIALGGLALCPPPEKVSICHRDQGKPEWKLIEIALSALPAHLAHQWGADIYPVPEGGCPEDPEPPVLCDDPQALNYGEEEECEYLHVIECPWNPALTTQDPLCVPPSPTPEACTPYNVGTWYECNTGNSTYTATSGEKCWCGGLTGRVHYHTTYDCGKSYVEEGNWDDAPDWLGYYKAPPCFVGGC